MSIDRAGFMPAPHHHIPIAVSKPFKNEYHIEYAARAVDLVRADIVTTFMLGKILTQRAGRMLDERGRWFEFDHSKIPRRLRNKRALWESGQTIPLVYRVGLDDVLTCPGVRELFPDPDSCDQGNDRVRVLDGHVATTRTRAVGRHQRVVEWTVVGSLIHPHWAGIRSR
jgi:hypothetical protein